ncbi:hypothetical protein JZ751_029385 [Albula glossodonta]|uniref:Lysozyme g n=1 Tax=Albula glossodonta TaxID=121402 RepID=A0A8T2PJI3_9TELE|nr:hypothetical protein JZ751_029385 [Albula glossodonta]
MGSCADPKNAAPGCRHLSCSSSQVHPALYVYWVDLDQNSKRKFRHRTGIYQGGTTMASIYGDVTKIDSSGASERTARQDKLTVQGVDASHKLAANDLSRMNRYKDIITKVGNDLEMDPAVICGIISRESRAGAVLKDGWGDHGNGFGLMQVDKRYHKPKGEWNSEEHINQGTEILIGFIKKIQAKFPSWSKEQQFKGVDASHKLAENDLSRINKYKDIIMKVAKAHEMDSAVICGIISRESRGGSVLKGGWCPKGNGFGLMQVDKRSHPDPEKTGEWNSEAHINQGNEILIGFIKKIQAKFPSWSKEQQFKGGISAYNGGPGNVQTYERMDIGTTGHDYANDVVARAHRDTPWTPSERCQGSMPLNDWQKLIWAG